MYRKIYGICLLLLLTVVGCAPIDYDKNMDDLENQNHEISDGQATSDENMPQPEKETEPVKEQIKHMTLEEKVGQLVIVGSEGYEIDENTKTMIEDYYVGGFILFGRNVQNSEQLLSLVNGLKITNARNKVPLFVGVDQEGGRVSRMPEEMKKLPSNKVIGEVNDEEFSYKIGNILAEEISSFGFNMDFAPVLDINSNPHNPVIGDRSFGSNEKIVTKLGIKTMKGIQEGGVIPVIKHFPGHGDTSVDSHIGLPTVDNSMERLKSFELVPFIDAIQNQADAVMIAHILLKKVDPESPASMSKIIITDLLRNHLNYNGVVITDDMTMGAITENYNIGDAAIKSIQAGSDIVLVCHGYDNQIAVIDSLRKAVIDGTIPQEVVDKSVYRILKLKNKYELNNDSIESIDIDKINNKIDSVLDSYLQQ